MFYLSFMVMCCAVMFSACGNKPEDYVGTYSCNYTPKTDDLGLRMYLEVTKTDTVIDARMAIHHYYREGFIYSEIPTTEKLEFSKKNDTLRITFSLPPNPLDEEADENATRKLILDLAMNKGNLDIISSNTSIIPNDTLQFVRFAEDDTTFDASNLEAKHQVSRYYDEIGMPLHGLIKSMIVYDAEQPEKGSDTVYFDKNGFRITPGEELEYTETKNDDGSYYVRTPRGDKYSYDANGMPVAYKGVYKTRYNTRIYTYDIKCNKIGQIIRTESLSLGMATMARVICKYEYDKFGKVCKMKETDIFGSSVVDSSSKEITVLEVDDHGNPTKIEGVSSVYRYEYYE